MHTTRWYLTMIFLASVLLFVNIMVISRLLRGTNSFKTATGKVIGQGVISWGGRSPGKAVLIELSDVAMQFCIQDNKERAFDYLLKHDVTEKPATILYDQNGPNAQYNRTFHIYGVTVNGQQIMTIGEAKQPYKQGLLILTTFEVVFGCIIYFSQKAKRKKGLLNAETL